MMRLITAKSVYVERSPVSGRVQCVAYDATNRRYWMSYYGYAIRDAVREFCRAVNTGELSGSR